MENVCFGRVSFIIETFQAIFNLERIALIELIKSSSLFFFVCVSLETNPTVTIIIISFFLSTFSFGETTHERGSSWKYYQFDPYFQKLFTLSHQMFKGIIFVDIILLVYDCNQWRNKLAILVILPFFEIRSSGEKLDFELSL